MHFQKHLRVRFFVHQTKPTGEFYGYDFGFPSPLVISNRAALTRGKDDIQSFSHALPMRMGFLPLFKNATRWKCFLPPPGWGKKGFPRKRGNFQPRYFTLSVHAACFLHGRGLVKYIFEKTHLSEAQPTMESRRPNLGLSQTKYVA